MATPTLHFRVATPDDAPQLQPLVKSAYRGEESKKGWTTEASLLTGERIDAAGIVDKITAPDAAILMATDEAGALVACCEVAKCSDEVAYFGLFAVDPSRQANGVGRKVLAHAEGYCRQVLGVRKLEMQVIWTREELIAWYIRRGYRRTGEKRPFPYGELGIDVALRDDLYFDILEKDLVSNGVVPNGTPQAP
jgi:GNAT superfamily N-acetyltransferase